MTERTLDRSLSGSINRFLQNTDEDDSCFIYHTLRNLRSLIEAETGQLCLMSRNLLLDLTKKLMKIVKVTSEEASGEALTCLALLGPIDLESDLFNEDSDNFTDNFIENIVTKLWRTVLSESGKLCIASGNAMVSVLSTHEGGEFLKVLKSYSDQSESSEAKNMLEFYQPFVKGKAKSSKGPKLDIEKFVKTIDHSDVWIKEAGSHEEWIIALVGSLLDCFSDSSVFSNLSEACKMSSSLSEEVFKFLMFELILLGHDDVILVISAQINNFFSSFVENVDQSEDFSSMRSDRNKDSVKTILSAVEYVRLKGVPGKNVWENNFLIPNLNYSHCSAAALFCGQFFSSLQFANIWCFQQGLETKFGATEHVFVGNLIAEILKHSADDGKYVLEVMFKSLKNIQDKDSSLGIGRFLIDSPVSRISNLLSENKHVLAASLSDSFICSNPGVVSGLVRSLHGLGMYHSLAQYLRGADQDQSQDMLDTQQECSWRLEQWDQLCPEAARQSFHGCILGGLESAVSNNNDGVKHWVSQGLRIVKDDIKCSEIESCAEAYSNLSKLRQLSELSTLGVMEESSVGDYLRDLTIRDKLTQNFTLIEPILSQRVILLKTKAMKEVERVALNLSNLARESEAFWVCNNLQKYFTKKSLPVQLEEATVVYSQGLKEAGIQLARNLIDNVETNMNNCSIVSKIFLNLGNWLDDQKAETSSTILKNYLMKSVRTLENFTERGEDMMEAYYAMAAMTDKLYTQTFQFMNSSQFKDRKEAIERNMKESEILAKATNKQKDLNIPRVIKERFVKLDSAEVEEYRRRLMDYLKMSLDNYLSVLKLGDKPLVVYRLISLWFNEGNHDLPAVASILHARLPEISSYKFIPLLYQMAARMQLPSSKDPSGFGTVLYNLILRCTEEHPHHTIPIILALVHAKEDEQYVDNVKSGQNKENDPRALASKMIINDLEKRPGFRSVVSRYRFMCNALIELAYTKPSSNSSCNVPSSLKLVKIRDWSDVSVLTNTVPVRPDQDYSGIVGVVRYASKYSMVGGINAPKKIMCTGTDGRDRPQLVKGKDDLRQDAVMEQVFGLLNDLLKLDPETRRRRLKVRTYKVVPLSQRSGILEWCTNTQPLSLFLEGANKKSGAHKKYHPHELDSAQCREHFTKMNPRRGGTASSANTKLQMFKKICANFSPAMKYFFFEQFPSAGSYYQSVINYTRSVAVNSMVGHILGLGDRHTNNILIDNASGEVIHIDLGVAFEQGRILPTPETIPFRLTRDIVDG